MQLINNLLGQKSRDSAWREGSNALDLINNPSRFNREVNPNRGAVLRKFNYRFRRNSRKTVEV